MSTNPFQAQIKDLETKILQTRALLADPELKEMAQLELKDLKAQKEALEMAGRQMQANAPTNDPAQILKGNCTVEIRPGTGGDEAKIWAHDLLRMYLRFADKLGLKIEFIDDLVIKIKGKSRLGSAYQVYKFESGVHRVQRVPATEASGRIHTSTASVAVLPEVPKTAVEIKDDDLEWQFMRASGAGGQSVNKTNSAVRLTHKPTGIVVTARTERKQAQNRQIALSLLRAQLWEIEEEKRLKEIGEARKLIGRAQRAEKIRTYNYPQNRITDHRVKKSWYNLPAVLDGEMEEMVTTLKTELEI